VICCVVDASIAVKWFVPESHAISANRLLYDDFELLAPDLIFPEFGNVLWKKWRRGEISAASAHGIIEDFRQITIKCYNSQLFVGEAWGIAERFGRSFYDSIYIALAKAQACHFVTADLKLYNALKNGPLKKHILWIEDIPDA